MDYYTGVVMKGYVEGFGEAVLSGGRYDNLLADFGLDVPAVGFAVNTDSVARAEMKIKRPEVKTADTLVFGENGFEAKAIRLAEKLSREGKIAETAVCGDRESAFAYAQEHGMTLYIDSDEITVSGEVQS